MKTLKKWEKIVGVLIDVGWIGPFIIMDIMTMLLSLGVCTVIGKIVEFFIGAPNWPEMCIAWLLIYLVNFSGVMEAMELFIEVDNRVDLIDTIEEINDEKFEEKR